MPIRLHGILVSSGSFEFLVQHLFDDFDLKLVDQDFKGIGVWELVELLWSQLRGTYAIRSYGVDCTADFALYRRVFNPNPHFWHPMFFYSRRASGGGYV